jgi:3'5'-cyclic nucleotide phosphodiesterase
LLAQLLRQVIARREAAKSHQYVPTYPATLMVLANSLGGVGHQVVDEVAEIISMPSFDAAVVGRHDAADAQISDEALSQLHLYVSTIARMYRANAFHNFEHASHVTMSVSKLLARIVAPQNRKSSSLDSRSEWEQIHAHTYGIATDPLTQFTVVLSAMIHDVDHRGVPNVTLAQEDKALAAAYKGKSIAEQNSVDIAWNTLMSEGYEDLRTCIFTDATELHRFRQLLINSVIATDIFDKELGTLRKKRWRKAFNKPYSTGFGGGNSVRDVRIMDACGTLSDESQDTNEFVNMDRKATIVIEHMIQASDVAHTMQHWEVYCKWNEKLFAEMYESFLSGRTEKDPSVKWYEGELGFFDNYIIPLAKKLKECGVFGVASDEYLNYATENRREWQAKGPDVVQKYLEKYGS